MDLVIINAPQAAAPAIRIWQTPSATRALATLRAKNAPALLPIPSPTRNIARIIEKVYTVAPSMSDKSRVHTTSAPRAHRPDRPMVIYTPIFPASPSTGISVVSAVSARYGVFDATANATNATTTLIATADVCRCRHVMHPQQIKSRQQTPQYGARRYSRHKKIPSMKHLPASPSPTALSQAALPPSAPSAAAGIPRPQGPDPPRHVP